MKILITGAFGYVGSRVSKYLSETTDFELILLTRQKQRSRPEWLKNGEVISIDYSDSETLESVCQRIEAIVHLAAPNEVEAVKFPEQTIYDTYFSTLQLLKVAEKNKIRRFIYFSTAHVYGAPLEGLITEDKPSRPTHPYSIAHRWSEDLVFYYQKQCNIESIVVRLSNSFGAPALIDVDRWTLAFNDFCKQAIETGKIVLKSSGTQERDFIPLTSVCRAVHFFLEVDKSKLMDGLFNLGGNLSMTILEVATLIQARAKHVLGLTLDIETPQSASNDLQKLTYSNDKLLSAGFSSKTDINTEVDELLIFSKNKFGLK